MGGWGGGGWGWGGEALPHVAYTGQVCAAEHKVLSIKHGAKFYYFNSKIPMIYFIHFIILIVKFYFKSKFALKLREQCLFGLEAFKRL